MCPSVSGRTRAPAPWRALCRVRHTCACVCHVAASARRALARLGVCTHVCACARRPARVPRTHGLPRLSSGQLGTSAGRACEVQWRVTEAPRGPSGAAACEQPPRRAGAPSRRPVGALPGCWALDRPGGLGSGRTVTPRVAGAAPVPGQPPRPRAPCATGSSLLPASRGAPGSRRPVGGTCSGGPPGPASTAPTPTVGSRAVGGRRLHADLPGSAGDLSLVAWAGIPSMGSRTAPVGPQGGQVRPGRSPLGLWEPHRHSGPWRRGESRSQRDKP